MHDPLPARMSAAEIAAHNHMVAIDSAARRHIARRVCAVGIILAAFAAVALGACSDDFADPVKGNKTADARLYRVDKCTVNVVEVRSHIVAGRVAPFEATINTCAKDQSSVAKDQP